VAVLLALTLGLLAVYAVRTRPGTLAVDSILQPGNIPGPAPDSGDYAYGALALLHGRYVVDWDGPPRVPRYSPGFPILLLPAVATGGVGAADRVPAAAGLLLGGVVVLLAWRLAGPVAAPLAVVLVLFPQGPIYLARLVMSDLPAVTLAVLEVALLALGHGPLAWAAAGVLGGALGWVRPANVLLLLAGLAGLTACAAPRRAAAWYALGAAPLLLLLGAWQQATFGSPLRTGYQAGAWAPGGSADLGAFFSLRYVLGPPAMYGHWSLGGALQDRGLPNGLCYPLQLLGLDGFLLFPGVAFLGLVALARYARRPGSLGVLGRFGLAALVLSLVTYLPYFYQSGRFLMLPAALLGLGAAVLLVEVAAVQLQGDTGQGAAAPALWRSRAESLAIQLQEVGERIRVLEGPKREGPKREP
jgi:hypothetical protein